MTRYQITVRAENLPRGSWWRKPHAYATVAITDGPQRGNELGRTETFQYGTLNPEWTHPILVETDATIFMPITVSIYDQNILLVQADFEVTEVFRNPGHVSFREVGNTTIHVSVEESRKGNAKGQITLRVRGLDLKNMEPGLLGLGRSDPFFEIAKKTADHASGYVRWICAYRSEVICDHLNPYWEPFTLGLEELCYANLNHPLRITVYDYEENGKHRLIGSCETTVPLLQQHISQRGNADREQAYKLFKEKEDLRRSSNRDPKVRGLIVVLQAELHSVEDEMEEL